MRRVTPARVLYLRQPMIAALALALTAAGASLASAASRDYPTCAEARETVARRGAAVIRTAPNLFDRYVTDLRFCPPGDHLKEGIAATRDNPACFVGYTCKTGSWFEDNW